MKMHPEPDSVNEVPMALTPKKRFEILQRDGFVCAYCGARATEVRLHVDHIVPRSRGGTDDPGNLITACHTCNQGKKARLIEGIEEERPVDPMQEVCASGMNLFEALEPIWHDRVPAHGEWEQIKIRMMELYFDVMDYGDLPEAHGWRERLETYRRNVAKGKAEDEARKKRER